MKINEYRKLVDTSNDCIHDNEALDLVISHPLLKRRRVQRHSLLLRRKRIGMLTPEYRFDINLIMLFPLAEVLMIVNRINILGSIFLRKGTCEASGIVSFRDEA